MRTQRPIHWIISLLLISALITGCTPSGGTPTLALEPSQIPSVPKTTQALPTTQASLAPTLAVQPQPTSIVETATKAPTQSVSQPSTKWLAMIGTDGNLWLVSPDGSQKQAVTEGAREYQAGSADEGLVFSDPVFSSDGQSLAFTRRIDRTAETGISSQYSLLIYDLATKKTILALENQPVGGYSWKPNTSKLVYAIPPEQGYFTTRGVVDATKAKGLMEYDLQTGNSAEIIPAARGYSLIRPRWSPLGDRLAFEEIHLYEGQGMFAYQDFKTGKYIAWDRPIGAFSWSADEKQIIYDYITYTPTPGNQIWSDDGLGLNEVALTAKDDGAYVMSPVFAPQGNLFVYMGQKMEPASNDYQVYVQAAEPGSQPKLVGTFESPGYLSWSGDGKTLLLSYGPYPNQKVVLVSLAEGKTQPVDAGIQPVWQP